MRHEQFSVEFSGSSLQAACEWAWPDGEPRWVMSSRGDMECRWGCDGPLTEEGRQKLLERFGLKPIAQRLPLDVVARMSPARLIKIRRGMEAREGLQPISIISDRIGGHIPAEMAA